MGGRGSTSSSNPFPKSLVQETVYHGTNVPDITKFNTEGRESSGAVFFANDLDYAEEEAIVKQESRGGTKTMYDVKINVRNPMEVELSSREFADNRVEKRYIDKAKQLGHDSVIFKEEGDPYGQTFYAVFSPKQVKIQKKRGI